MEKMTASEERQLIIGELRKITELLGLQINMVATPENMVVAGDDPNAVPEMEETCDHQNTETVRATKGSVTRCLDCGEEAGRSSRPPPKPHA